MCVDCFSPVLLFDTELLDNNPHENVKIKERMRRKETPLPLFESGEGKWYVSLLITKYYLSVSQHKQNDSSRNAFDCQFDG